MSTRASVDQRYRQCSRSSPLSLRYMLLLLLIADLFLLPTVNQCPALICPPPLFFTLSLPQRSVSGCATELSGLVGAWVAAHQGTDVSLTTNPISPIPRQLPILLFKVSRVLVLQHFSRYQGSSGCSWTSNWTSEIIVVHHRWWTVVDKIIQAPW